MTEFEVYEKRYTIVERDGIAEVVEVQSPEVKEVETTFPPYDPAELSKPPVNSKERVIALAARDHQVQRAAGECISQGVEWHQMQPPHYPRLLETLIRQNHGIAYVDPVIETAIRILPRFSLRAMQGV
jgi:hypothetical protein